MKGTKLFGSMLEGFSLETMSPSGSFGSLKIVLDIYPRPWLDLSQHLGPHLMVLTTLATQSLVTRRVS